MQYSDQIFALVNWHLGSAIYVLPGLFIQHGIGSCVSMLLVCGLITIYVYDLLRRSAAVDPEKWYSYPELVGRGLGQKARCVLCILVILNAMGVFTSYETAMSDILKSVDVSPNGGVLIFVVIVGIVFYVASQENAWDIPGADLLANGAVVVLLGGLIMLLVESMTIQTDSVHVKVTPTKSISWSSFQVLLFAFSSAEVFLTFSPSVPLNALVSMGTTAVAISFVLYSVVGTIGSLVPGIGDNALVAIGKSRFGWVVLLSNYISLALSLPVFIITARRYFYDLVPMARHNRFMCEARMVCSAVVLFTFDLTTIVLIYFFCVAAETSVCHWFYYYVSDW